METDGPKPPKPDLSAAQLAAFNDALRAGIEQKNNKLMNLALKNGADPHILMFAGIAYKPPWWPTVSEERLGLQWVELAVQFGADVNATNPAFLCDGLPYPAIHCACANFNEAVSDLLLLKGASVDTPSPCNNTPLMRAISSGLPQLASYYLKKGADPMRLCSENGFPLQELQQSDKFKPDKKSKLLTLMMQHVRAATPNAMPAGEFNEASVKEGKKTVELARDLDLNTPLSLKPRVAKPSPGRFEL